MTEPIKVYRGNDANDAYGDPKPASLPEAWPLWKTLDCLFAPDNPDEQPTAARSRVIKKGTVYIRGVAATEILDTDQVEIRGTRFDVDGSVDEWSGYDGYKGDVFRVKAAI